MSNSLVMSIMLGLRTVSIAIYRHGCPQCGGDITNLDIKKGCCRKCSTLSKRISAVDVILKEAENLAQFFTEVTGFKPWSLQNYWIKRLVSGESFAMVAPTGVGKSTLLAVYSLYRAYFYRSKVYIITPTREIAKQMYRKIIEFLEKIQKTRTSEESIKIVLYDSSNRNNTLVKEDIRNGNFHILITSVAFLTRYKDLVIDKKIDIVIADDLDSIMKNSKSVDKVLSLLGFSNEDIDLAQKIIKLRQNLFAIKIAKGQEATESLRKELLELEAILRNNIAKKSVQLVVASATGRIRGLKSLVLKLLLGFDAGAVFEYWRNIADLYYTIDENFMRILINIVKKLGSGIIFVSPLYRDLINIISEELKKHNIRVEVAKSGNKAVDRFRKSEVDVLIGSTSYYGILVRGLDEPLRIRYTIFVGIPSIVRDILDSLNNVRFMYAVLRELKILGYNVDHLINSVSNIVKNSTPSMLYLYSKLMKKGLIENISEDVAHKVMELQKIKEAVYNFLKDHLKKTKVFELKGFGIVTRKGSRYIFVKPDPYTYIQASGRCSRLYNGSKTFGVSIVFEEYVELIHIMDRVLRKFIDYFSFDILDINKLDEYREKIEKSRQPDTKKGYGVNISTALILVESPTKAKTIANMFGKPAKRNIGGFTVYETLIPLHNLKTYVVMIMPTMGHVTDLIIDEGIYGVKINNGIYVPIYDFITKCRNCNSQHVGVYDSCPYCGSLDVISSSSVYNAAKMIATEVDEVFLAMDPDTEGEKIAYDLYNLLLPYNSNIYRIEFKELTRTALLNALNNPREINLGRVKAQIARRIADRWIGFELSLWLQMKLNKPWLGAGRVQSPVLLWITSRYREYREGYGYALLLDLGGYTVKMYLGKGAEAREKALNLLDKIIKEGLKVEHMRIIEREISPPPPFTTDTLIYEANVLYGFSASKTMALAQSLFELGLITYHRTDSPRVSSIGISIAHEVLKKLHMEKLHSPRSWNSNLGKEDAHEAIRPTNPISAEELIELVIRGDIGFITRISEDHIKLYDLIFRRFMASQMINSKIRYLQLELTIDRGKVSVEVPIEIIVDGFTKIYPIKLYTDILRNLDEKGQRITVINAKIIRGSTATLYRVADIVKLMKDKGIGRPSTYAKAIDNNIRHGYIITSKRRRYLIPTKLGLEVAEIINQRFLSLVGEDVTKELEELLDRIEEDELDIDQVIETIRKNIDIVMENVTLSTDALPNCSSTLSNTYTQSIFNLSSGQLS
ncbi:MAG: reverse gyrase [Ignisphaera sp.]